MEAKDLLNKKRVDFNMVDSIDHAQNEIIYKDKTMTISILDRNLYMSSKWWGTVKNSFFTLDGMKGSSRVIKHGIASISDIGAFSPRDNVDIDRHNKVITLSAKPNETEIQFLGRIIQQRNGKNITYGVVSKIGPDNAPVITVKLVLPNGKEYLAKGSKKQIAANNAAKKALEELNVKY